MSFSIQEFWDRGFCKCTENIPTSRVLQLYTLLQAHADPDRGHDKNGNYYNRAPSHHVEWANWWSQDASVFAAVNDVVKFYMPQISLLLDDPVLYHTDFVVTTPHFREVKPHIDTPYRFESFENEQRLLGVQCLLPLTMFDNSTGSTAFVPGSHREQWDIKKCYKGEYNEYFSEHCEQTTLGGGEMVIWHPRVLHSAMPNNSPSKRCALLMLFVESDVHDEIRVIDNIFT